MMQNASQELQRQMPLQKPNVQFLEEPNPKWLQRAMIFNKMEEIKPKLTNGSWTDLNFQAHQSIKGQFGS